LDINNLTIRELQTECARALATMSATSNNIAKFNKQAPHDSQKWYKTVIEWYIAEHGGLPSKVGPGKDIKLISENG